MGFIALACFMPWVVISALIHGGETSEQTWTRFGPKLIFWKGHTNDQMILSNKIIKHEGKNTANPFIYY